MRELPEMMPSSNHPFSWILTVFSPYKLWISVVPWGACEETAMESMFLCHICSYGWMLENELTVSLHCRWELMKFMVSPVSFMNISITFAWCLNHTSSRYCFWFLRSYVLPWFKSLRSVRSLSLCRSPVPSLLMMFMGKKVESGIEHQHHL